MDPVSVTIYDVARKAGVSVATVSRIINNKGEVSPKTKAGVLQVMEELDYHPTPAARTLKKKGTGLIGLIVPDLSNQFFSLTARGVQDRAKEESYHVVLCNGDNDPDTELEYLKLMERRYVDGLIFVRDITAAHVSKKVDSYVMSLRKKGYPLVIHGVPPADCSVDSIVSEEFLASQQVVEHLIDIGHTRIGLVGGAFSKGVVPQRVKAYEDVLSNHHLLLDSTLIVEGDGAQAGGYKAARLLLNRSDRPSAIFAINDMVALGVYLAAEELGLVIPKDLAVVGFDDIPLASMIKPRLSTVSHPKQEIGRLAADLLIARIKGDQSPPKLLQLQSKLVIRESTLMVANNS